MRLSSHRTAIKNKRRSTGESRWWGQSDQQSQPTKKRQLQQMRKTFPELLDAHWCFLLADQLLSLVPVARLSIPSRVSFSNELNKITNLDGKVTDGLFTLDWTTQDFYLFLKRIKHPPGRRNADFITSGIGEKKWEKQKKSLNFIRRIDQTRQSKISVKRRLSLIGQPSCFVFLFIQYFPPLLMGGVKKKGGLCVVIMENNSCHQSVV